MAKGTQVRVSENTKETITLLAARIQEKYRVRISSDLAIRVAIETAFPDIAVLMGIDTSKEIEERGDDKQ